MRYFLMQRINCFSSVMYILASDFFKKTINTYLKLEIRVVCREFLAFKYVFIVFVFKTNQFIIYIRTLEIFKTRV